MRHFPAVNLTNLIFPNLPTSKVIGISQGNYVNGSGYGLLADLADASSRYSVTPTSSIDTGGAFLQFDTTATQQRAGYGGGFVTRFSFNPKLFMKLRTPTTTSLRGLFGLTDGNAGIQTNDAPLVNNEGFALQIHSTDANYNILHNDGGAVETSDNTGVAKSTATIGFYMDVNSSIPSVSWKLWVADVITENTAPNASGTVTTDLPASTTNMSVQFLIYNTTAANRILYRRSIIIVQDV